MEQSQKINFNINQQVLVKLTDYGKLMLCKDHYEFWLNTRYSLHPHLIPKFELPKEDSFGYSKWQLWSLMEHLGKYCSLGSNKLPFETEIIIIKEN